MTSAKVTKVERKRDSVVAAIEDSKGATRILEAERMISAVGVAGNVENLGLEALGVKTERGVIIADGMGRTNVPGVYAIGDVAGPPMLAHKAEHEGVICVEGIKGLDPHPMDKALIPSCTYCNPQIASTGLTEAKAKELGFEIRISRFPFIGNGKSRRRRLEGTRQSHDAKGRKALAHMVGAEVTELIKALSALN